MKRLTILATATDAHSTARLLGFAEVMGVPATLVRVEGGIETLEQTLGSHREHCLAATAETLAALEAASSKDTLESFVESHCAAVLVLHMSDSTAAGRSASAWTRKVVEGIGEPEQVCHFNFCTAGKAYSRQLGGLDFELRNERPVSGIEMGSEAGAHPILMANGKPVFVHSRRGACDVFVLSLSKMPDVTEELTELHGIEQHYDAVLPILIFMRAVFGQESWHAPAPTARLIIDDPLLVDRYGYLDFSGLAQSIRGSNYGVTIAFIPWNHWRTSTSVANRLLHNANLSICVHGCDHSNREFEAGNAETLQFRGVTGLQRMRRHEQRTGIPFEPVMVFPQGRFTKAAGGALRASGYLAAVNSTCFPTDADTRTLRIGDFLKPAVNQFSGFPIFQRRYPHRLVDCAFDMFIGRPVLLVEHHQFFKQGFAKLEEFVAGLYAMEPKLKWPSLSSQLRRACRVRKASEQCVEVEFFTREFEFCKPEGGAQTRFLRAEPMPGHVTACRVNGVMIPFRIENGYMVLEVEADPGTRIRVEVVEETPVATPHARPSLRYQLGVPVRRALSELRDNTLVKYPRVLKVASTLATLLKATGGRPDDPGQLQGQLPS